MRKILTGIIIVLILAATLSLGACSTTAIWTPQTEDSRSIDTVIDEVNPSAPDIVYLALAAGGEPIALADNSTAINSYAVIGYVGTVKELVIPASYNGKNVVRVLMRGDYADYKCFRGSAAYSGDDPRLDSNPYVESIVFGRNVTFVGSGVCAGMTALKSLTFLSTTTVTIGTAAFAATLNLTSVSFACASGTVTLNGNFSELAPGAVTYAS